MCNHDTIGKQPKDDKEDTLTTSKVKPLVIGQGEHAFVVDPPVVLAPMAGVTNPPYRAMCRQFGGGLYTSEMVGARGLYEAMLREHQDKELSRGRERTLLRAAFSEDETVRSMQLYSTNPEDMGRAVAMLTNPACIDDYLATLPAKYTGRKAEPHTPRNKHDFPIERNLSGTVHKPTTKVEDTSSNTAPPSVDHIDINMGCPAGKVTRHGGGAALPWKHDYALAVVQAALDHANGIPITVKTRVGIDDDHIYAFDFAQACQDLGVAALTLHARTAYQAYGGHADWTHIAKMKAAVTTMPILGNGDIWAGVHARAMMDETGCDGVVVGRGCLGRPWLFRDIQAALNGEPIPTPPTSGELVAMLLDHAARLEDYLGSPYGLIEIRKHTGWYLQGFPVGPALRRELHSVTTMDELKAALSTLDPTIPMPPETVTMKRGHTAGPRTVKLPEFWLDSRSLAGDTALDIEADTVISGG